ncbi:MAG: peptidase M3 [Ignavibacteria bacterium RIFOXYB2_FULL_35_12]|nr:MAG: peptidase M3 [Ignavibacteria bacterium GWA2_36_19]OGU53895.1 MAG: peptidase M3 [Ignavibacteria bacterium GWC2_35_8]OGU55955.1 MAG: peptidase M3 [Ignavibacteria bacterium GWF2_35_20]OGU83182.1 MAG: peptidase M3 [Ignavibacteria bacterium RIFOXYA2_FULL_35_9]OGU91320.1 MAG: peptidase M3 [Ignavibacteria bacterium RIFOXYC12_FULL_35_11]OGU93592.1 MAG: peptidase M3 [Ignavibacteria bacterium RIFOXYB12_FULL_35_14]OGV01811.1 MAG: peptidase M3 [Ignavibacteria bacterium RIFOXYC2_FULL_35_16]OGV048
MKRLIFISTIFTLYLFTITSQDKNMDNSFFKEWSTPFQTPPFEEIKLEHYLPAFEEGIKLQKAEVDKIINNTEKPTFENTIEAMEKSGKLLTKVSSVFYNLNSANTNDEMQKIAKTVAPMLSKHNDDINLNEKLFAKVKSIYNEKDGLNLTTEQNKVSKDYYDGFIRGGANLTNEQKEKFRKLNEELSLLSLKFGENLLKETNAVGLIIDDKNDLLGLPESVMQAAFELGKAKGHEGKWVFTLQKPSFIPFLQYSEKRNLREKIFKAYINRSNNNNDFDNKKILSSIAALRVERANLLGYKTHADYILEKNMAKNSQIVYEFLTDLWKPALKRAKMEIDDMQKIIYNEGNNFKLEAWDWWYYAEKVKKEKYDLDEEMLRPYFKLENVLQGVFDVASKLYGIQFVERNDIPMYHPDVKVIEVKETTGNHIAILFTDYFPRDSKRSGAWMNSFRKQSNIGNNFITPIIGNVGNFSKPTSDKPSLLSLDEVETLFHEFGHALHGILSNSVYPSVSGTSVPRDFVELCSQIMENWALAPEVLKMYAKHYQTNEPMPDDMIKKIENSKLFNQGFETVEYLAASFLDMDWHTLINAKEKDAINFEKESLSKIGLIPEIESRYQSTNFQHIFSGGYSAGYYSYIWAAVLDADAFEAFEENGLFDQATALSFRKNILEKGGSEDPMELYKRFRGREPKVDALLKRRGLN